MEHSHFKRLLPAVAMLVVLPGCSILSSQAPNAATPPSGVLYHLPKAVLPVKLVLAGETLELRMDSPQLVADPAAAYLLAHPANAFSDDNVKVELADGRLLGKLTVSSDDKTLAALTEAGKALAIGRTESSGTGEMVLASGVFDPDQTANTNNSNGRLLSDLSAALQRQAQAWQDSCKSDPSQKLRCQLAERLLPAPAVRVMAQPLAVEAAGAGSPKPAAADCSVGICYRGQRPFEVRLEIDGLFAHSTVEMLPNGGPPIALPLDRAPFVKTEHVVEFERGQLKSVDTKRPSSALQVLKWPLDVYQAILKATSELVTLRIGDNKAAADLAKSQLDTAKELQRIGDEMAALRSKKELSQRSGPLLSITLGERRAASALLPTSGPTPGAPADCGTPGKPCPGGAPATPKSGG